MFAPGPRAASTAPNNLALRCRAHNALEADRDYGKHFMQQKREKGSKDPLRVKQSVACYVCVRKTRSIALRVLVATWPLGRFASYARTTRTIAVVLFAEDLRRYGPSRLNPLAQRLLVERNADQPTMTGLEFREMPHAHKDKDWSALVVEERSLGREPAIAKMAEHYTYPGMVYRLVRCASAHALSSGYRVNDFSGPDGVAQADVERNSHHHERAHHGFVSLVSVAPNGHSAPLLRWLCARRTLEEERRVSPDLCNIPSAKPLAKVVLLEKRVCCGSWR